MIIPTFRFYSADNAIARRETVYAWHKRLKEERASDKAKGGSSHTPYLLYNNSSADLDTMVELFARLENGLGEKIDILKLHIDCFRDFSMVNLERLIQLKNKYKLTLWEDRKFADIGVIVKKQIDQSLYCYDLWVDIFTIHSLMGKDTIDSLQQLKYNWILVGEMSTANNLMNEEYVSKSLEIYKSNSKIVGIVTQHFLGDDIIHIVPGISKTNKKDNNGQVYHTMEKIKVCENKRLQ